MDPTTQQPRKPRYVTIVYKIEDEAAWQSADNLLNYQHHGLKSMAVTAGDLASLVDAIEAEIQEHDITPDILNDLIAKHVRAYYTQ